MKTLEQLQEERNVWVTKNFPGSDVRESVLGVIEEVGELAHAHLKAQQGIRGTEEEHAIAARDAIGDALVYLLGVATNAGFSLASAVRGHGLYNTDDGTHAIFLVASRVGRLASDTYNFPRLTMRHVGEIYWALAAYCSHREWDLMEILNQTWDEVSKRDWTANRQDGTAA